MYTRPCDYIQLTQFFAQQIKSLSRWAASPLPFTALGDTSQNWREASAWDAGAHRITRHIQGHLFSPLYLIDEETEYQRGQETCLRSQSLLMAKKKKKKETKTRSGQARTGRDPGDCPHLAQIQTSPRQQAGVLCSPQGGRAPLYPQAFPTSVVLWDAPCYCTPTPSSTALAKALTTSQVTQGSQKSQEPQ